MGKRRFLTKSRFKTGYECATKLHYLDDERYASDKLDDKFLKSLAEGGVQVGELAKLYFEGGIEVTEKDHEKAAAETRELLKRDEVVIFEAALMHENLFVRVDVLVKKGRAVRLLEVKAKSWGEDSSFTTKKGERISSDWESYIADIAFQRYVAMMAYPEFKYACSLYLMDKQSKTSVEGLHQRFFIAAKDGRSRVEVVPGTTRADLGQPIMREVPADNAIELFVAQDFDGLNFAQLVDRLSALAADRSMATPKISRACGACEYRVAPEDLAGKQSGFVKCWTAATGLKPAEFERPMVFDIWNLHHTKKERILGDGRYFMAQVTKDDIEPDEDDSTELSANQRQWLQVEFQQTGRTSPHFETEHFLERKRVEHWRPPYHFIDFETLASAIPFQKGRRPYETLAFQFSHHVIDRDGSVRHENQYINAEPGAFPNFEFTRKLRDALSKDDGTVFRYAAHENTVLNQIRAQLGNSAEPDKADLIRFIDSLTVRKEGKKTIHEGARKMVDMLELVKRLYYSPLMGGSNSIKKVLPAVLNESEFLKAKYSKPVYGAPGGIPSLNYKAKTWITLAGGRVQDPYLSLEPLFSGMDEAMWRRLERILSDDEIREGGAASTAYARMQFSRMTREERAGIEGGLLRYCELDTLAMVMIWEYWTEELVKKAKKAA